ncbi:hypothetical protein Gogos_011070 [Gossypium gossypioides]|uniref:Uncharacterized protein n=1 Tax=Gossypium gossypioides TaxID=34282 RepID=A0A7J9BN46_GOSGO|nr:hypothetical protein [Gossypium gossypioides]
MIDGNKSRAKKEAKWVGGSTVLLSSRILMCDAFVWQDRVKRGGHEREGLRGTWKRQKPFDHDRRAEKTSPPLAFEFD